LELWTSLLEVVFWKREAKPWPAQEVEPLLAAVPLEALRPGKRSFMARFFGRAEVESRKSGRGGPAS
jgi:hypothetical protein